MSQSLNRKNSRIMQQSTISDFKDHVKALSVNGRDFQCRYKISKAEIVVKEKVSYRFNSRKEYDNQLSKSDRGKIANLFKRVKESYERYIMDYELDYPVTPKTHASIKKRNNFYFRAIPEDTEIVLFDINRAFWQIAHKLGIIDKKVYEKFNTPFYKLYTNIALASYNRGYTMVYYSHGSKKLTITEDMTIYKNLYNNIRYTCYNLIQELVKQLAIDKWYMYNQDALLVSLDQVGIVEKYFADKDYLYKKIHCRKYSDKEFIRIEDQIIKKL